MTYVVGPVLYNWNSKECFSFMVNRAIFLRDKNVERSLCYFEKALKKSPLDIHLSFYVRLYSIKEAENTFLKELENGYQFILINLFSNGNYIKYIGRKDL